MEDERRYGTCPVCNEKKMLISFLASYKGKPVAGWMCNKCYDEIRNKPNEKKEENGANLDGQ